MSRADYDAKALSLIREYARVVSDSDLPGRHSNNRATELSSQITAHASNFDPAWFPGRSGP